MKLDDNIRREVNKRAETWINSKTCPDCGSRSWRLGNAGVRRNLVAEREQGVWYKGRDSQHPLDIVVPIKCFQCGHLEVYAEAPASTS